jgi:hypothetical protein
MYVVMSAKAAKMESARNSTKCSILQSTQTEQKSNEGNLELRL